MSPFVRYAIPIHGLKSGVHNFEYRLDAEFFQNFEESPIQQGVIEAKVELDIRPDMLIFDFDLTGKVGGICDRCTADIQLELDFQEQLLVKYGEPDPDEDDEVVFITREAHDFNLAHYLYEYAVLALPLIMTYDCENDPNPPCNREVLKYLTNESGETQTSTVWDNFKKYEF